MLNRPDITDERIATLVGQAYGIDVTHVTFLPLGADVNAAVFRVSVQNGADLFLKLRRGQFDETCITLSAFLSDQGIAQIIRPITTSSGQLWTQFDGYKSILYPFIEGLNGYETRLSERHWRELGNALKKLHTLSVPPSLQSQLRQETYDPLARETVKKQLMQIEFANYVDPIAQEMASFLLEKRVETVDLIKRAEQRALALQTQQIDRTICHSDLHAGNILIGADDAFYIVDWDEPI